MCISARTYPVHGAEVHRLCEVEALVEAAVVGPRERDDELPGTLVGAVDLRRARDQTVLVQPDPRLILNTEG